MCRIRQALRDLKELKESPLPVKRIRKELLASTTALLEELLERGLTTPPEVPTVDP